MQSPRSKEKLIGDEVRHRKEKIIVNISSKTAPTLIT
nr:MAG TPA: hypothetical protein [Caudoviricetes sp.]